MYLTHIQNPTHNLMKRLHLLHTFCSLTALLCAVSCHNAEEPSGPTNPQVGFLESRLADNYWLEEIHFLYQRDNRPEVYMDPETIVEAFDVADGTPFTDQVLLKALYVDPDNRRICRYVAPDNEGRYTGCYLNAYSIEYDEYESAIRIRTPYDSLRYMGATSEVPLSIVSMAEDRVIFDAPIKPFIRLNWELDTPRDESITKRYLGLRIIWTRQDAELFRWAQPLD